MTSPRNFTEVQPNYYVARDADEQQIACHSSCGARWDKSLYFASDEAEDAPIRALAKPEINYIETETDQQSIVKQILPPLGKDGLHNDKVTEPRKERRVTDQ